MISPQIRIDPALKALWPEARLACLTWRTLPAPENPALWSFFTQEILPGLNATLQDTPLAELPNLGASRRAYKAFGRDPGRTRVSSEALYRRIRQGKDLYRINSVVDANNLVSLETAFPWAPTTWPAWRAACSSAWAKPGKCTRASARTASTWPPAPAGRRARPLRQPQQRFAAGHDLVGKPGYSDRHLRLFRTGGS